MEHEEILRQVERLANALRMAAEITGALPDRSGEDE